MRLLGIRSLVVLAFFAAAELTPAAARAAICTVPSGGYPTIAAAVADVSCTEIDLGSATYTENVSLSRDRERGEACYEGNSSFHETSSKHWARTNCLVGFRKLVWCLTSPDPRSWTRGQRM